MSKSKLTKHSVFSSAGSLNYIGKVITKEPTINYVTYNTVSLDTIPYTKVSELPAVFSDEMVTWIEVSGIHKPKMIEKLGIKYDFHPLMVEDLLNTTQKPKIEYFQKNNHLFIILKVPNYNETTNEIENEHICLVLGQNFVISFQEQDNVDVFSTIITRLNRVNSKTKARDSDYLFYSLIDIVVDNYFQVIDIIEEKIMTLEKEILEEARDIHQNKIFFLKRELAFIRKTLNPFRDIIQSILREDYNYVSQEVKVYFRDVLDHVFENIDATDTLREDIENLMVNYHSQLSNRMNAVMKTLTVFTAIFMPLTFIVGVYGMNFDNMPELHNPHGYFITLGVMFVLCITLWVYFKWKKYI